MDTKRIIYYYQTFNGLQDILYKNTPVTHIHLSAIHFGLDKNNKPYIHLNNNDPESSQYDKLWSDIVKAQDYGIKIILMVGGEGGAYNTLFENFEIYYDMLINTIRKFSLNGIDLDIEEYVSIDNIKMLINRIHTDTTNEFIISMAPIQSSLETDKNGMGNFVYKDLYNSQEGKFINYFNGQFYEQYDNTSYTNVIKNGYPPNKIVMGMLYTQDYDTIAKTVNQLSNKYNNFGGVFLWEYCYSKMNKFNNNNDWAVNMKKTMNNNLCLIS